MIERSEAINESDEKDDGLSDLQIEAQDLTERINDSKEAAERIKARLFALRYRPASIGEIDMSPERLNELKERNKAISWFLRNYEFIGDNLVIKRADLKDARFFSIMDLVERSKERVELVKFAMIEIQKKDGEMPALQRLSDEYLFRDNKLFDVDKNTSKIIMKEVSAKDLQEILGTFSKHIDHEISYGKALLEVLESGKSHIDPGVLIASEDRSEISSQVKGVGGIYKPGYCFRSDLKKTGLIIVPPVLRPSVLKHEYAHFEDWLFREERRRGLHGLINEINSFFLGWKPSMGKSDLLFENIKGVILNRYLRNYIGWSSYEGARKTIIRSVDTIKRMYKNGFSAEAISSILTHADSFDDILQWENVNDEEMRKLAKEQKK